MLTTYFHTVKMLKYTELHLHFPIYFHGVVIKHEAAIIIIIIIIIVLMLIPVIGLYAVKLARI
jgi:hypothetical protein